MTLNQPSRSAADPRVDAYLAALPAEQRSLLAAVRERVRALAPGATELISYGMPAFKLGSQFLLSYAAWKRHCSIYPPGDELLRRYATELEGYGRTKGSLHFTPAQPLPAGFLDELVRERVAAIESGRG
jgi:uncharacterized protein YdhG (YjbR/CyaY superfamily)